MNLAASVTSFDIPSYTSNMQIKASVTFIFGLLMAVLPITSAQYCNLGGKHIGDSCSANPGGVGGLACGDHRVVSDVLILHHLAQLRRLVWLQSHVG